MGMFDSVLQNYVGIKSRFINGWVILFLHSFIFLKSFWVAFKHAQKHFQQKIKHLLYRLQIFIFYANK